MKINVYKPYLNGNEKKYVDECLESTWISSKGEFIKKFEDGFAKYIGIKYATGTCNGTVPIHLALLSLGVKKHDEIIVPSFTYIASINPITWCGAIPVFADSLSSTLQVDPKDIERKITKNTKGIIVVHLYGHPCDMDEIMKIAKKHNLFVIEDAAEAFGAKIGNRFVGSYGDIATFSFFGNKTITCGEGGMAVTNNKNLYEKMVHLKGQGVCSSREYWHDVVGYNYRMTNVAAAIGFAQLEQANIILKKKRKIADLYFKFLKNNKNIRMLREEKGYTNSYWMITILTKSKKERDGLRNFLKTNDIETRPTFWPAHLMPVYISKDKHKMNCEKIAERGINLPSHPSLENKDILSVCRLINKFYE